MSHGSTAGWEAGHRSGCGGPPRRALEIAGIVVGFIYAWPLALAYLVWKVAGYPKQVEAKAFFERHVGRSFDGMFRPTGAPFRSPFRASATGNFAFEEYRRAELARLEEERRRLDEEANAFGDFVDELKRAKDREEFDAFMAKRRGGNGTTAV